MTATAAAEPLPFCTPAEREAERAMAGIAVGWPERAAAVDLEPRHFHDPRWSTIFRTALMVHAEGRAVDPLTVIDSLESQGLQGSYAADVADAISRIPTASNAEHYAEIVRDGWVRRQVAAAAADAIEWARGGEDGAAILSDLLGRLAAVHVEGPSESLPIRALLKERWLQLGQIAEAKSKGEAAATGIPTGLDGLDHLLGGLQRGIVTVAAARPGMGKSSFALACVRHATSKGIGAHVFSLEDTRDAYCDRVLSSESLVPAERLRQVSLTVGDLGQLRWSLENFPHERPWIVDDRSGISAEEIVRSVRRSLGKNRTQLVVVDYIQLLRGQPRATREEVISHAMHVLADAAKQDRIAYLVLAQLNRECERRDDKRPLLSDLKQAGTIEERAKCVIALYRPCVYDESEPADLVELLIRKNNQGRTGTATARWDGETIRMY